MARSKKNSLAEDVVSLVALLPWWTGVILALLSFTILHSLAKPDVATPLQPSELSTFALRAMWKAFAHFAQFIIPLLCLAGAFVSFWRRRRRQSLMADVTQNPVVEVLAGMTWQEFEMLVGEAFRAQGYCVLETGGSGPDGSIDLVLRKKNEQFLVQCKQWKAYKVGVDVIRELYGVMAAQGAAGGFVVTSGRFTKDALAFAAGRNVKLIDGPALLKLIRQVDRPAETHKDNPVASMNTVEAQPKKICPSIFCPTCGKPMVRRIAKRGMHVGQAFWGCSDYPKCKATRAIE